VSIGEAEANARLIAAAPEMRDALKALIAAWDKTGEHGDWDCAEGINNVDQWWDVARAAIAKATGDK
jgi:hypothetical protein